MVFQKHVFIAVSQVDVEVAIVIVIGNGHARVVMRGISRAHGNGHIDKDAVAVAAPEMVSSYTVGHVEVEVAVAIEVEPRRTRSNPNVRKWRARMGDVAKGREGHVGEEVLGLAGGLSGEAGPAQQQDTDISSSGAHHDSL